MSTSRICRIFASNFTTGRSGSDENNDFVFQPVGISDALSHRYFVGLRFISYVFLITGEVILSSAGVPIYTIKLGLDY